MSMLVMRCMVISIHAPPRGATGGIEAERDFKKFQFTPLREGRPQMLSRTIFSSNFNSRPSARGDLTEYNSVTGLKLFQFTPLREGRQQKICNFCKSFVQPLQISMA